MPFNLSAVLSSLLSFNIYRKILFESAFRLGTNKNSVVIAILEPAVYLVLLEIITKELRLQVSSSIRIADLQSLSIVKGASPVSVKTRS